MVKILKNKGKIKLSEKGNEDFAILNEIEQIFISKRGYVAKLSKERSPVAACMSGGADSVANIFVLLNEFHFEVFPFFINRGQSAYKYEKEAIRYYDKWFLRRFPNLYHKTLEIKVGTPAKEYKDNLREVKKKFFSIENSAHVSYPARNSVIFLTGMEYALSLLNKGKKINTLFASHVSSDTSFHCSLTWHRILNLEMCHILHNWNFQFISLPIEISFGNYYDKDVYLKYCEENGLDLTKTRTCVRNTKIQCGECPCCWDRRRAYKEAGIKDKTKYLKPFPKEAGTYY